MKRYITLIFILTIIIFSSFFLKINRTGNDKIDDWGVTLSVKGVTPTSATVVCTQHGGNPTGSLQTGSYYIIEKLEDGNWKILDYAVPDKDRIGWTMEAWLIPFESTVEWKHEWEWLYGQLSTGKYRIGKEITDFRETGIYDSKIYYAEFDIN